MRIRAAVCRSPDGPPAIEELELDEPRPDEVLVRLVATGVCHTDLLAPRIVPLPAVFGHEGAGIVERVGSEVRTLRAGDRVVLTFGSCGSCRLCTSGEPAYCEQMRTLQFSGTRLDGSLTLRDAQAPVHGAFFQQSCFATHAIATVRNAVKIDAAMPLELAAPLGCGIQTGAGAVLNTLCTQAGASLAVFGVGSVGLAAVMGARIAGCATIVAIDVLPERLELARALGATHALDAREGDLPARIGAIARGGVHYSIDTAGTVETLRDAVAALAHRGVCAIVTVPAFGAPVPFSFLDLLLGGRSIVAVLEGSSVPERFIPRLVDLHLAGRLPIERLIREYPFASVATALEDAHHGRAIKPVLRFS